MDEEMMIQRGRGLVDLIAGVTPTLTGWTTDPTDAADITDGDITTFCTTGTAAIMAWAIATFTWMFGATHQVLATGVGECLTDAGTSSINVHLWNGSAWVQSEANASYSTGVRAFDVSGALCSGVRLALTCSANANISPNIREFSVWRLS